LETTDMLWLDNETAGSSPAAVASCARAFMARLTSLRPHNPCGVYSFFNFITSGNCAGLGSYPLWLAIFQSATPTAPAPWHAWKFWQSGEASGHDNDVFNGTPAELTAWINSFQPNVEVEVQSGQLNNGAHAVTAIAVPHGSGSNIAFGEDAVVGCSALSRSYRDRLLAGRPEARMVFLAPDREVLARRLAARHGHFFPEQLLGTQLDALEPPGPDERVLTVVPADDPAATVEEIIALIWQGHEAEA